MKQITPRMNEVILFEPRQGGWLHFANPVEVITADTIEQVLPALQAVERSVEQRDYYAAGFLAYEAAPAMGQPFQVRHEPIHLPLLWFGIYPKPDYYPTTAVSGSTAQLPGPWSPSICDSEHHSAVEQVRAHIAHGYTYQVNLTYRLQASFVDDDYTQNIWPWFAAMAAAHMPPYAAFLETVDWAICSFSPELFFTLDGHELSSLPMKGTAPRGHTTQEDQSLAEWLQHSEKNRAENLMIVDMVRNDMGRIARTGSVHVPRLFQVDQYPTVWQMISEVCCTTGAGLTQIMQALFPAASITGAPKVRTMQIITELETTPRGIYTGTVGYYAPNRQAQFNVAIRTLLLDKKRQQAVYGVGGGIVWDSDPAEEWAETITKARILHEPPQPFQLLETLRWTPEEGWFLLPQHLARLQASAAYFAFPLDLSTFQQRLIQAEGQFQGTAQRVRLLLARDGSIIIENQVLPAAPPPAVLGLAVTPVQSGNRFLYHKTTRRTIYQYALAERPGCADVLLHNERGEITESCIANLVYQQDGKLYTPPVTSGLLPGTYRAWLLESGLVTEKTLARSDLNRCERLFLVNSVRGMWEIQLTD